MMTVVIHGPYGAAVSEGSHRLLGQASSVHEESGYRLNHRRTVCKVMPSLDAHCTNAQRPDTSNSTYALASTSNRTPTMATP